MEQLFFEPQSIIPHYDTVKKIGTPIDPLEYKGKMMQEEDLPD